MKTDYQFIKAPLKLRHVCSPKCYYLLLAFIEMHEKFKASKILDKDGYFFMSMENIMDELMVEDRRDAKGVIEALYRAGLIKVICEGKGKGPGNTLSNKFKINFDKIIEYNSLSLDDIKSFDISIKELGRKANFTYHLQ